MYVSQADTRYAHPITPDSTRRHSLIMIAAMHHEDRMAAAERPLMLKVVCQRLPVSIGNGRISCRCVLVPFSVTVPARQSMSLIFRLAISPDRSPKSNAQRMMAYFASASGTGWRTSRRSISSGVSARQRCQFPVDGILDNGGKLGYQVTAGGTVAQVPSAEPLHARCIGGRLTLVASRRRGTAEHRPAHPGKQPSRCLNLPSSSKAMIRIRSLRVPADSPRTSRRCSSCAQFFI